MDSDRYLDDLSDWLLVRDAEAAAQHVEGASFAAARERAADLAGSDTVAGVVTSLDDWQQAAASARRLELMAGAVTAMTCADARREVRSLRAESLRLDAAGWSFDTVEAWLCLQTDPRVIAAAAGVLNAAGSRIAEAETQLASELIADAAARRLPPPWDLWSAARGRHRSALETWAREIVEGATPLLSDGVAGRAANDWGQLPRILGREALGASLVPPDGGLAAFVAERLGLERLLDRRVRFDLEERPGKHCGDRLSRDPAGPTLVRAARRPLGRLRDYRGVLRLLGRSLSRAGLERVEGMDAWRADPALEFMYGALFESQLWRQSWQERTFGSAVSASITAAWRQQTIARCVRLAGEVVAASRSDLPTHPDVPTSMTEESSRDLPMQPHSGLAPWAAAAGPTMDELAGRLVAPSFDDLLASRWGSDWLLHPAAGTLLRDLWAAGHPTLEAFCVDLALDTPSAVPALESWRSFRP